MQTKVKQSLVILLISGFYFNAVCQNGERHFDYMEEEEVEEKSLPQAAKTAPIETVKLDGAFMAKSQSIVKVTSSGAVVALDDFIFDDVKPANANQKHKKGAFGELIPIEETPIDTLYFQKKLKAFPATYTGYSILLHCSNDVISQNHWLKSEFVGIMEHVCLAPKYAYFLGKFSNKISAENFLNTMVKKRIPNAKIIEFKQGERISIY